MYRDSFYTVKCLFLKFTLQNVGALEWSGKYGIFLYITIYADTKQEINSQLKSFGTNRYCIICIISLIFQQKIVTFINIIF